MKHQFHFLEIIQVFLHYRFNTHYISITDLQEAAEFSALAYVDNIVSVSNGYTIMKVIQESMNEHNEIKAMVAENAVKNEIIISFRGAQG